MTASAERLDGSRTATANPQRRLLGAPPRRSRGLRAIVAAIVAVSAACGASAPPEHACAECTTPTAPASNATASAGATVEPATTDAETVANRTAGTQTAGTQTADTETADTQTAGTTVPLVEGGTFPLRVEPGLRYLVDASGSPFLMQGEAAWSLIAQLCREEVDIYLDDRKARGFNTILVNLVEHKFASNAPRNCYGDAPFTNPDDMSTPNEAYFEHADWVMQRTAALDFAVLLVPSYAGYTGTDEGWYSEMQASGPDKLREYGRYVGERYQHFSNIVWVQGGDDNPPDKELVDAISEGIAEFMPTALQTAHTGPETSALDYWGDRPWLDVNNVYTYGDVYTPAIEQYERSTMPYFLMESAYENEHDASTRQLRTQAYQALLAGATGQLFGNNPIWHFGSGGLARAPVDWQEALGEPGSRSMSVVGQIFGSLRWWDLVPDTDGSLVIDGVGEGNDRAVGAMTADGALAVVYIPTERSITLDLQRFRGSNVTLTWYDPSNGTTTPDASSPVDTTGHLEVSSPGPNADGDADWLLIGESG